MERLITDLLSGTPTREVIGFAGRMLGILLAASVCLIPIHKLTPRWCYVVTEYTVLAMWIIWALACLRFQWEFSSRLDSQGWTPDQIDREFGGNVLGFFGLAEGFAALAIIMKVVASRERWQEPSE